MRVAIYARMSTDKEPEGCSLSREGKRMRYRYEQRKGLATCRSNVLCFAMLMLLTPLSLPASAADRLILEATPSVRVVSSSKTTHFRQLTKDEREAAKVRIEIRGGKLVWVTREERELIYSAGGIMHHFIEPGGGGYVTVMDQSIDGTEVLFFEHVRQGLTTITYWGEVSAFRPPKLKLEYRYSIQKEYE